MPAIGNQQQPIKGCQIVREAPDVTNAKAFASLRPERGSHHESGRYPRQAGDSDFGKRRGQQEPRNNGEQKTAARE